ncbi:hypothetical protein FS749_012991 [Ceratobasidium sp. UAMH 11750]|nr:hypothetical protein FS749_012991 [Ceratobasidium sp. UAMH 11750]
MPDAQAIAAARNGPALRNVPALQNVPAGQHAPVARNLSVQPSSRASMPPNNPPTPARPIRYLSRGLALADPAIAAAYKKLRRLKQPIRVVHCARPPGSPGRGGYNLKKTLNMTGGPYSGIRNIVKLILLRCSEVDPTRAITQQRPKSLVRRIIEEKVAPLFPEFDIFAREDYWPLEGFAHLVFKSWRNKYLKDAQSDDDDDEPAGNDADMGGVESGQVATAGMDANHAEEIPSNNANDGWDEGDVNGWDEGDINDGWGEGNANDGWGEVNANDGYDGDDGWDNGHDGWDKGNNMDTDVQFQPPPEYRQDPAKDSNGDDDIDDLVHNMSSIRFDPGPGGRPSTPLQSANHQGMDIESPGSDSINMLPADLTNNVRAQTPVSRMPSQPAVSPTSLSVTATATSTATSRSTSTATSTATSAPIPQPPSRRPNSRPLVSPQLANRLQQIHGLPENLRNRQPEMFQRVMAALSPRPTTAGTPAGGTARSRPRPKMRPPPPTDAELDAMPDPEPEFDDDRFGPGEGLLSDGELSPVPEEGEDVGAGWSSRGKGRGRGGKGTRGGARGRGRGRGGGRGGARGGARGGNRGGAQGGGRGGGRGGGQIGGQGGGQGEMDEEMDDEGYDQAQGGGGGQGQGRSHGRGQGQRNTGKQTAPGESTGGGGMAAKQTRSRTKAEASTSTASTSTSGPSRQGRRKAGN